MTQVDPITQNLPPGVSERELANAIDAFAAALASERVLTSEEDLREFRDPFAFSTWDAYTASAVVMPETVEEVQASSGSPTSTGSRSGLTARAATTATAAPPRGCKGSVIVSLRRMNRVLEIDEECAYAVVEPGVRWFDLYEAIQAGGHRLMLSIADLGWGSVVGNTLDHGVTYLPVRRRHVRAVRHGGRAPERRGHADRDGRDARQPGLARLQARPRPDARPALHAVELRDRDEDGRSG